MVQQLPEAAAVAPQEHLAAAQAARSCIAADPWEMVVAEALRARPAAVVVVKVDQPQRQPQVMTET